MAPRWPARTPPPAFRPSMLFPCCGAGAGPTGTMLSPGPVAAMLCRRQRHACLPPFAGSTNMSRNADQDPDSVYNPTRDQPRTLGELHSYALCVDVCRRGSIHARIPVRLQPAQVPGLAQLLAYCEAEWGTNLTPEAVRKIRGLSCRARGVDAEQADRATLEEIARAIVPPAAAAKPGLAPPTPDDDPFAGFSTMERKLLLALRGRGRLSIANLKRAVYGRKPASNGALEQVVRRANRELAE